MNIISFSLWGSNPKYTIGAVKNALLAKDIYPGWQCIFYVADDVPSDIIAALDQAGALIVNKGKGDWRAMTWRFEAAALKDSTVIVRDTDSRLNLREKAAVVSWLNSKCDFHIIRDHPFHASRVMGGMWGARNNLLADIKEKLSKFTVHNCYDSDQQFLRDIIYPGIIHTCMTHDPFYDRIPFPKEAQERTNTFFVGQAYDENDNPLFS